VTTTVRQSELLAGPSSHTERLTLTVPWRMVRRRNQSPSDGSPRTVVSATTRLTNADASPRGTARRRLRLHCPSCSRAGPARRVRANDAQDPARALRREFLVGHALGGSDFLHALPNLVRTRDLSTGHDAVAQVDARPPRQDECVPCGSCRTAPQLQVPPVARPATITTPPPSTSGSSRARAGWRQSPSDCRSTRLKSERARARERSPRQPVSAPAGRRVTTGLTASDRRCRRRRWPCQSGLQHRRR